METYLVKRIGDFTKYVLDTFFVDEESENLFPEDIFIELARPIFDWELRRIKNEFKKDLSNEELTILQKRNEIINTLDILSNKEDAINFLQTWFLDIEPEEEFLQGLVSKQWFFIFNDISISLGKKYIISFAYFSQKFNLRYSIRTTNMNDHILQLKPEVIALEELLFLKNKNVVNYEKFSREFSSLLQEKDSHIFGNILKESSNLAESIANLTAMTKGKTLSDAIKNITPEPFPHKAARESLDKIYGFYSDYKGIRHGGGSDGFRELEEKDAIYFSLITLLFASFLLKK